MPAATNDNKRQFYNPAVLVFYTFSAVAICDCALVAACFTFCDTAVMLIVYAAPALAVGTAAWWKGLPESVCGVLLVCALAAVPVQFSLCLFWHGGWLYRSTGGVFLIVIALHLHARRAQLPALVTWMFEANGPDAAHNRELNHTAAKIVAVVAILLLTNLAVATYRGVSTSYQYSLTQYDLMDLQDRSAKAYNDTINALYGVCINNQIIMNKEVDECAGLFLNETALTSMLPAQRHQIYLNHRSKNAKLVAKLDETESRLRDYERRLLDNPFLWGAFADPVGPLRDMLDVVHGFANLTVIQRFISVILVVTLGVTIAGMGVGLVVYSMASENEDTRPGTWTKIWWAMIAFFLCCVGIWYTNPMDLSECVPDPAHHAFRPSCYIRTFVVSAEQLQAIVDAKMHTDYISAVEKARREAVADSRHQLFGEAWPEFENFDKARVNESVYVLDWYEKVRARVVVNLKTCTFEEADAALKAAKPDDDDGKLASDKMGLIDRFLVAVGWSGVPAIAARTIANVAR